MPLGRSNPSCTLCKSPACHFDSRASHSPAARARRPHSLACSPSLVLAVAAVGLLSTLRARATPAAFVIPSYERGWRTSGHRALACPLSLRGDASSSTKADWDGERRSRTPTEGTTFVPTENGHLVEVGCINTKHDFIIDEHMLGKLPERAPVGKPLGNITLVGAGPGDPDLLTMAAYKALVSADVVVADRLVSQEILELVQNGELKVARKLPGCALEAQREIYRWCAEAVLAGKNVVRLKIGDPYVFGRGGEEVLEFRQLGVEPKVVPGISSALAGPLAAGIPVTHRGMANRVVFCTGMNKDEAVPDVPPYHKEQSCVFLMAVGRLAQLVHALATDGYPASTPVAIIERATTPRERTLRSDLASVVAEAEAAEVKAPAIVVVGSVVLALHAPGRDARSDARMPEDMVEAVAEAREAAGLRRDR